jgi:hypothetical protein
MLRDGVAWYDRKSDYGLTDAERVLYAQCEQAARDEKRGLWSDAKPVPPWEYQRARVAKLNGIENPTSTRSVASRPGVRNGGAAFTSVDLVGGAVGPGSLAGNPTFEPVAPHAAADEWVTVRVQAPRFSIRVPGNSYKYSYPILDGDKKITNFDSVVGSTDEGVYFVMWGSALNDGGTEATIADETIQGVMSGVNKSLKAGAQGVHAVAGAGTYVRLGLYAGKQFPISAGPLSGFARIVSRQVGDRRELIAVAWFTEQGSESGAEFSGSLKIAAN